MMLPLLCLLLVSVAVTSAWPYDHVLVNTANGPVQGDVLTLHTGDKINTFLGIPYAEPPVGARRWAPPESINGVWSETFIADRFGPACTQADPNVLFLTNPTWSLYSEDCLNINIYAPNATGTYPVLLWFYGGGFAQGASIQYPGHFLASQGVIVVVPNYRLNFIGFLTTSDSAARGNWGMLDQAAALRWVQTNIRAFGGDPTKVTIAGESAGAASTGLHLLSSMSRGLFHGAFLASGCENGDWVVQPPESHPEDTAYYLAEAHDCPTDNTWTMIDCLRKIDSTTLRDSLANCTSCEGGFGPVVDNLFLTGMPIDLRKAGNVANVPEIIGQNREESSLSLPFWIPETLIRGLNRTEFEAAVREISYGIELPDESRREDLIQSLTWYYSPWPHLDDERDNRQQLIMMTTDAAFGYDCDWQMKMHSSLPATTYQYLFSYISDNATVVPDWMGCPHMLDVPYFWGFPMLQLNDDVRNQTGIVDVIGYTDVDIAYATYWMTLATNFVKTGNPTQDPVATPNGDPATSWAQTTDDNRYYLYVGNDFVEQRENYRQQEYAFWHSYLNKMIYNKPWPYPPPSTDNMRTGKSKNPFKYVEAMLENYLRSGTEGEF